MPRKVRNSITQQFAWRTIQMLESPAYRVLSLSAHRVLARLEIEFARHGGRDSENGKLPCTYADFIDCGVHKDGVAPAIRELVALGFAEVTEQGLRGDENHRRPNRFRLCHRHRNGQEPTDEWRRIKTVGEAEKVAADARRGDASKRSFQPPKPTVRRPSPKLVADVPEESGSGGRGWSVCRFHGAHGGAPVGNRNRWRRGRYSAAAIEARREIAALIREARRLAREIGS